jgi:hypothetical protein
MYQNLNTQNVCRLSFTNNLRNYINFFIILNNLLNNILIQYLSN